MGDLALQSLQAAGTIGWGLVAIAVVGSIVWGVILLVLLILQH